MLREPLPDERVDALASRLFSRDRDLDVLVEPIATDGLSDLREHVASWAERVGLADQTTELELTVHELAANAVIHGGPPRSLAIATDGQFIAVAVHDSSHTVPDSAELPYHGLWILARLTDGHLNVIPIDGDGKWVVAILPAEG